MKRLTERDAHGTWRIKRFTEILPAHWQACNRLAAYEETGLEPEEIEQLKGEAFGLRVDKKELEQYRALGLIDRLRELAQADKENRVLSEGSGWFVTCNGKKLTIVMDIEAALRREQE